MLQCQQRCVQVIIRDRQEANERQELSPNSQSEVSIHGTRDSVDSVSQIAAPAADMVLNIFINDSRRIGLKFHFIESFFLY